LSAFRAKEVTMTTPPVQVERRVGQRFPFLLPVSLRLPSSSLEGVGFTQDLSSRGVFFFTEMQLTEGMEVELTLRMPSEITLGESMPVRCRGHVLRVARPLSSASADSSSAVRHEDKIGVAVRLEGYEYLPEASGASASVPRAAVLHSDPEEEQRWAHTSPRS
jgi:hypothetical protein